MARITDLNFHLSRTQFSTEPKPPFQANYQTKDNDHYNNNNLNNLGRAGGKKKSIDLESNFSAESTSTTAANTSSEWTEWNWNFFIVSSPFLLLGFPIHLLIGRFAPGAAAAAGAGAAGGPAPDGQGGGHPRHIKSAAGWIKAILVPSHCLSMIFSGVLFIVAAGIVAYFGYVCWNLGYNLLWLGAINDVVIDSCTNLIRIIPVLLPLLYFWCFGFKVKHLLDSFDSASDAFDKSFHLVAKAHSNASASIHHQRAPTTSIFWCKILTLYLVIAGLHSFQIYLEVVTTPTFAGHDFRYHLLESGAWVEFAFEIMCSLILPIYCMFCWALQNELQLLIGYLNLLVFYNAAPSFLIFNEIKYLFKKIARQIINVNKLLSLYVCVLFLFIWGFAGLKLVSAGLLFFQYWFTIPEPVEPGGLFDNVFEQEEMAKLAAQVKAAVLMRQTLGYALIALVQTGLLAYTTFQAVHVNKAARCLHVILNDFVTYNMSKELSTELYQAFRLLKAFIHSTMERLEDPALLRIPILNYVPYFGTRLHTYQLRN